MQLTYRKWFQDRIYSHRCWGDQRSIDLHRLNELSDSISVDDPRDRSDREDMAGLWEGRRACKTHTPTWRANCRQNIVGSPSRGIPRRQIDQQRSVRSRTKRQQRHTSQTGSGRQYDVIPYCYGLLVCISYRLILRVFGGGPCPPYIVRGAGLQVGQI